MGWKWYNKLGTKIREKKGASFIMPRKQFNKEYKISAVKMVLEDHLKMYI